MQGRTGRDGGLGTRGVSHVIGVALLVAITALLIGVVAVYTTGFAGDLEDPAPTFVTTTAYDDGLAANGQYLNVSHDGGDTVETDDIRLDVDGARVVDSGGTVIDDAELDADLSGQVGSEFAATETVSVNRSSFTDTSGSPLGASEYVDLSDAVVRIIYDHGPGERTDVIYECRPKMPDCKDTPH